MHRDSEDRRRIIAHQVERFVGLFSDNFKIPQEIRDQGTQEQVKYLKGLLSFVLGESDDSGGTNTTRAVPAEEVSLLDCLVRIIVDNNTKKLELKRYCFSLIRALGADNKRRKLHTDANRPTTVLPDTEAATSAAPKLSTAEPVKDSRVLESAPTALPPFIDNPLLTSMPPIHAKRPPYRGRGRPRKTTYTYYHGRPPTQIALGTDSLTSPQEPESKAGSGSPSKRKPNIT
eukprot:Platyproteum_vivax@DN866_c0_g1_i1.p1